MIRTTLVDQTTFGTDWESDDCGNCLQACLATILELPLESIPHFVHLYDDWMAELQRWLRERGLTIMRAEADAAPKGLQLMGGESPRHPGYGHVIVSLDGQHYHDPHPSRAGVVGEVHYYVFVALDPKVTT